MSFPRKYNMSIISCLMARRVLECAINLHQSIFS